VQQHPAEEQASRTTDRGLRVLAGLEPVDVGLGLARGTQTGAEAPRPGRADSPFGPARGRPHRPGLRTTHRGPAAVRVQPACQRRTAPEEDQAPDGCNRHEDDGTQRAAHGAAPTRPSPNGRPNTRGSTGWAPSRPSHQAPSALSRAAATITHSPAGEA